MNKLRIQFEERHICSGLRLRTGANAGRPLGDSVADMIHITGLDFFASFYSRLTGLDCGCRARQEALNRLAPNVGLMKPPGGAAFKSS